MYLSNSFRGFSGANTHIVEFESFGVIKTIPVPKFPVLEKKSFIIYLVYIFDYVTFNGIFKLVNISRYHQNDNVYCLLIYKTSVYLA